MAAGEIYLVFINFIDLYESRGLYIDVGTIDVPVSHPCLDNSTVTQDLRRRSLVYNEDQPMRIQGLLE